MKKNFTFFTGLLITFFSLSSKADIIIDGNFADWNSIPYSHQNAAGTGGTLLALKTFGSATHIYFLVEGTVGMTFNTLQMYFDTDNNPATGYNNSWQYGAGAGADYRLEGNAPWWGGLYQHSGNPADDWAGFTEVSDISIHTKSPISLIGEKTLVEFSITKASLGTLGTLGAFINIAMLDNDPPTSGTLPAIDPDASTAKYLQINTTGNTTLPITLASFTALSTADAVKLNWSTYSEQNNSHFEIYRSTNGTVFEKIATVKGANNSPVQQYYSYTDFNPFAGLSYYELKQVDNDGKVTSLGIKDAKQKLTTSELSVVKLSGQDLIQLSVYSENSTQTQFQLSDINGKILLKSQVNLVSGLQKITLPFASKPGVAIATIKTSSKLLSQKILIN